MRSGSSARRHALCEFLVAYQIVHCGHVLRERFPIFRNELIHVYGIFAHGLRYCVPFRFLGSGEHRGANQRCRCNRAGEGPDIAVEWVKDDMVMVSSLRF
jgi:hypothetical protein